MGVEWVSFAANLLPLCGFLLCALRGEFFGLLCVPSCPLVEFLFRPDRPGLPVVPQRQQSQPKAA
jgi:hypothetical protein